MQRKKFLFGKSVMIVLLMAVFICGLLHAGTPENEDIQYRDYLISILDTLPRRQIGGGVEFPQGPEDMPVTRTDEEIHQLILQFLDQKLKQDFKTEDTDQIGANIVAVEVIKRALTEDLNINPGKIPPQQGYEPGQYLNILIELSKKTPEILQRKYHINLNRLDVEKTTRVRENILALQSFMRDDKEFEKNFPIDDEELMYTTCHPFFFYQDEWQQYKDTSFYPENHYSLKKGLFTSERDRERARTMISRMDDYGEFSNLKIQLQKFLTLDECLLEGHRFFQKQKYALALEQYTQAVQTVFDVCKHYMRYEGVTEGRLISKEVSYKNATEYVTSIKPETMLSIKIAARYNGRGEKKIKKPDDLKELESLNTIKCSAVVQADSLELNDDLLSIVPHVMFFLLPVCLGDLYTETGEYVKAAYYYSFCFPEHLLRNSLDKKSPPVTVTDKTPDFDSADLPWNWTQVDQVLPGQYYCDDELYNGCKIIPNGYPYLNKKCEIPFMKMRICRLYLEWADKLYRSDKETDRYRARELYKAVLREYDAWERRDAIISFNQEKKKEFMPGNGVLIASNFFDYDSPVDIDNLLPDTDYDLPDTILDADNKIENPFDTYVDPLKLPVGPANPIMRAQMYEAYLYFRQIEAGLNFFGFSCNEVPTLRYEVLMQSAKYFANLAKQAEDDYITYTEKEEKEEIELMNTRHAIDVASIRIEIENQRISKAGEEIKIAEIQVQQVKDAIKKKEKELEKKSSFWGQVKSYFKGMASFVKNVPSSTSKSIGKDFLSEFKGTETAGAGVLGGIAIFGVSSAITIKGMVDEANNIQKQLNVLRTQTLPMAEATLASKKKDLAIARLQKEIAVMEEEFLKSIYLYHTLKILNAETWNWMATIVKKSLQRYLDLGAMTGWLAQRAASFEQNRNITLIGFNYYNPKNYGLTSSDAFQNDLANLEKEYLVGFRHTNPIKWSVSLSRDYPLSFGQLLSTGSCQFTTDSEDLKRAFPGSCLHRIKAVNVVVISPVTEASYKGTLGNPGISSIDDKVLIRSPESLPISDFRLKEDMALYGLPGKSLMTFEGNGIDTSWELKLPPDANPDGLSSIADIIITFDLYSQFDVIETTLQPEPQSRSRLILFSYKQLKPDDYESFINSESDSISFPIEKDLFSPFEIQDKTTNVYIQFIGRNLPDIIGTLSNNKNPGVQFTTADGLAYTTHLRKPDPLMKSDLSTSLDQLNLGKPLQNWTITISGAENSGLQREAIDDIIFGIEYEASLSNEAAL
ncbi:MAG: hypothetical protein JXB88_00745 [Spirochaetales bacterium]|nr:hypothetical protein [Spirochaetales bacterium]